jgi:hypothetical protein
MMMLCSDGRDDMVRRLGLSAYHQSWEHSRRLHLSARSCLGRYSGKGRWWKSLACIASVWPSYNVDVRPHEQVGRPWRVARRRATFDAATMSDEQRTVEAHFSTRVFRRSASRNAVMLCEHCTVEARFSGRASCKTQQCDNAVIMSQELHHGNALGGERQSMLRALRDCC